MPDVGQVLAFRLARSGLASREGRSLADAPECPASDFSRDAALLALAARVDGLTRDAWDQAVDAGDVVVAHVVRGAINAVRASDFALWGRALIARDDAELVAQLGEQVRRLVAAEGFSSGAALDEVADATKKALAGGRRLGRNDLHEAWRGSVRAEYLPWCKGCGSYHVAPMLWRYATVRAGVRLDAERRYTLGKPGRAPAAADAVRRFLRFYGPATPGGFTDWAGLAKPHARRLWDQVAGEMDEVDGFGFVLSADRAALESPPAASGVRLLPPGDPYLQKPNRRLLAPDEELRKRLFRPVGSPGAVLKDGRLVGLWRSKARGKKLELTVERIGRVARGDLEDEARRVAALRRAAGLDLVVG